MSRLGTLYTLALANCEKVTTKLDDVSLKAQEMVKATDWQSVAQQIYDSNKEFVDNASEEMLREWKNGIPFNSGMFAGVLDRVILDGFAGAGEDQSAAAVED